MFLVGHLFCRERDSYSTSHDVVIPVLGIETCIQSSSKWRIQVFAQEILDKSVATHRRLTRRHREEIVWLVSHQRRKCYDSRMGVEMY